MSGSVKFPLNDAQNEFISRLRKFEYTKATFISDPYDTKSAMGNSSIFDDYRKVGIYLNMPISRDKLDQINKTKENIVRIRVNARCSDFISAIQNARYPEVKE